MKFLRKLLWQRNWQMYLFCLSTFLYLNLTSGSGLIFRSWAVCLDTGARFLFRISSRIAGSLMPCHVMDRSHEIRRTIWVQLEGLLLMVDDVV